MADNLTHSWSGSATSSNGSADNYTWTVDFSTINAKAREKIPPFSKITAASLYVHATHNITSLTGTVKGKLYIRFVDGSNNSKLNLVTNDSAQWKPTYIDNTINLLAFTSPSYASTYRLVRTETSDAGDLYFSGATRLYHYSAYNYTWSHQFGFQSTITWTYNEPRAIVSVSKSGEGTVTGAGTYHYNNSYTITATPAAGWKFVKWSDGDTNASRTFTVNSSLITAYETSKSYQAVFEKIPPPKFTSVSMSYLDKQISSTNKVTVKESFIISVSVT